MAAKPARSPNRPAVGSRTPWTGPSARPAKCCKVLDTGFLGTKAPLLLQQCPRIILVHGPKHYILGAVASSKYPYKEFVILSETGASFCTCGVEGSAVVFRQLTTAVGAPGLDFETWETANAQFHAVVDMTICRYALGASSRNASFSLDR